MRVDVVLDVGFGYYFVYVVFVNTTHAAMVDVNYYYVLKYEARVSKRLSMSYKFYHYNIIIDCKTLIG